MELDIPKRAFGAYLFDCDGTIADSMPLHFVAWNNTLARWGCKLDTETFYSWAGLPIGATIERLNAKFNLAMPVETVVRERENAYFELLPRIKSIPAVLRQIELQHGKIPLAVVSGSPKASLLRTLDALQLTDRFAAIVGADDCARGKPHPDGFLLAARKVGVAPGDCLVFEDADLGIQAAQAAGMEWVRIPLASVVRQ